MTSKLYRIALTYEAPSRQLAAEQLAQQLGLEVVALDNSAVDFLLTFTAQHLELRQLTPNAPSPIYVDFLKGALAYRQHQGGTELLTRAIGLKKGMALTVVDATAGFGSDAWVLLQAGCQLQMIERSPVIAALLRDGLCRAGCDPCTLILADAQEYLLNLAPSLYPDVIYLDPMYPHEKRTALAKKELRLIRELVGDDQDAEALFAIAQSRAQRRVVVKRPYHAPFLANKKPAIIFKGKACRFDVYL